MARKRIEASNAKEFIGMYDQKTHSITLEKKPDHFMRKYQGWGIDCKAFDKLPRGTDIQIFEKATNKFFHLSKEEFLSFARKDSLGHGTQYFVAKSKFKEVVKAKKPSTIEELVAYRKLKAKSEKDDK